MDLAEFRSALREHGVRSSLQRRKNPDRPKEDHEGLVDIVERVGVLLRNFIHQSTRPTERVPGSGARAQEVFRAGRCIVPIDTSPAVVLDATGRRSPIYPLFPDSIEVVERTRTCRTYERVTLHVGRLRGLGKGTTLRTLKTRVPQLAEALRGALLARGEQTPGDVVVVTHKDAMPVTRAHRDELWGIASWGSFHGVNAFQHRSAIAFFSLFYPDDTISEIEFNTARGTQPDEWFQKGGGGQRVRHDMRILKIANSLVQAINRVRCRRPIDRAGNCLSTDVYLPLPHGTEGDEILAAVEEQMPKIRKVDWDLQGVDGTSTHRRGKLDVRGFVREKLEQMEPGEVVPTRALREDIGCRPWWFSKVLKELADPSSELGRAAAARGIRYRRGRLVRDAA
jgi:hypothetical protein